MFVRQIADAHLAQFAYLVGCPQSGEAIVFDPQRDVDRYFDEAKRHDLRIVGAVPALAWSAFAVTSVWMLAAMVVAVRQALDYRSTSRAITVCALGWLLSLAVAAIIGIFFPTTVS